MSLLSRAAAFAAAMVLTLGLSGTAHAAQDQAMVKTPVQTSAIFTQNTPDALSVPDDQAPANDFNSLAEAVAAHQDDATADEALRCVAGAVYFESRGEPLSGQLAVAEVIINRAKSGRFPANVCGVVTQRGQFGFVRGGRIPSVDEDCRNWRTALAVARVALADAWDSEASKALYFNRGRAPAAGIRRIAAIGHHVFYR